MSILEHDDLLPEVSGHCLEAIPDADADRHYGEPDHDAATDLGNLASEPMAEAEPPKELMPAAEYARAMAAFRFVIEAAFQGFPLPDFQPPTRPAEELELVPLREIARTQSRQPLKERTRTQPDQPQYTEAELLIEAERLATDADAATIRALASKAGALDKIGQNRVLRVIKRKTETPLGDLRSFISDSGQQKPDDLTLSRLVLAGIGRELIFATDAAVYRWEDRGVWWVMQDIALKQLVQHGLEAITAVNASTVCNVANVLKTEIYIHGIELNRGDPSTVNTRNGELVLNQAAGQWELRPHNRDAYRTTQLPVKYDPRARAPRFVKFLEEVFRDDSDRDEKIECLLQLIGYTLMSHCRFEKFVILIGSGANGKSVFLAVLEALLGGENVASVQPSLFDNPFYRAHLYMRLANFVTELKEGEVIADAALKSIVSGESTTASRKFQHPFDFRPYATCWFGTNHLPHTRDFSDALFRRAVIITFNRKFDAAKGEADPMLKEKLICELPGILNMALDAYARWVLTGKFTEPNSSLSAKKEWRLEADQVQQFVEDCCTRDAKERVQSQQLYNAYRQWADGYGINQRLTQKSFVSRLERLGFGRARTTVSRYVTGISLHPE